MNNILVFDQSGRFTCFCKSIAIGRRTPKGVIGDEVKSLLENRNMTVDELIKSLGNSYRETIVRVVENNEIPKKTTIEKLCNFFNVEKDYFEDKELENVIIVDNGIVVGKYKNDKRALEIKSNIDEVIHESCAKNLPIIVKMPIE